MGQLDEIIDDLDLISGTFDPDTEANRIITKVACRLRELASGAVAGKPAGFIFLAGNISEGHMAVGPYESFDECADECSFKEGWVMGLCPPEAWKKGLNTLGRNEAQAILRNDTPEV